MLLRLLRSLALPKYRAVNMRSFVQKRTLIAAPKEGQGPLMERRADRELPDIPENGMKWMRTVPIFLAVLISSTLAIFNYQKSSSSVVSSTMYALRTSPKAREYLGDEIYFAHKMPWIWGEMNQLHGRIDIQFEVKGSRESGTMRFKSFRATRQGMFETTEWSLETKDGSKIDLLDGADPFVGIEVDKEEPKQAGRGSYAPNLSG
ncbi:probable FMP35 Found in Mitochondrial Proteome [Phialocephala subalpina]|uniref:Probable FMP35 Found in Mitochondrial Proteome n=1 Tax=Phialocephala subalpina TaxID=576137 RepID=A0A1L7WKI7_9HELO|nr:probable FMP35 Found in Mitochondrial Proteome [Phialocephala subalpina]